MMRNNRMFILSVSVTILTCLGCAGTKLVSMQQGSIKPANSSLHAAKCAYFEGKQKLLSGLEERLHRNGAVGSRVLNLKTDFGCPDKYLTVYRVRTNMTSEYTLCFHFPDRYDYDFLAGPLVVRIDGDTNLTFDIVHDEASVICGDRSEQYFSVTCSQEDFKWIADSKMIDGTIGEIGFRIPYECREEWRQLEVCETR